jgi:hypothetical protein
VISGLIYAVAAKSQQIQLISANGWNRADQPMIKKVGKFDKGTPICGLYGLAVANPCGDVI